ncbi:MAG TPA: hypothetical protein VM686_38435, partial [Polyangiaceae bacterium]|nr:hypothetical protein [Polyangiaceae bacterium]
FASTRGNTKNVAAIGYSGPQRTPADPSKLNSNLYVLEDGKIRQLTFLLNQELSPSFMRDGRLIMTTEKRQPGFYQLAGRRMNLDGGDYHPLFGQRATVGFNQFTDVVELADKNLAAIMSDRGAAHGAGALAVINRSIGIDQTSQVPDDYLVSFAALDTINPDFFQRSIRVIDPVASGKLTGTQGAYRSPSPLPDGKLLVSYAANVVALDSFSGNFDVHLVDPVSGAVSPLVTGASDELWPVAVYRRTPVEVFTSRFDEANGATRVYDDSRKAYSRVTILDVGVLTSLLFQNTRTGRTLGDMNAPISVWESLPPEPGVTSYSGPFITNDQFGQLYVRRQLLGDISAASDGSADILLPGGAPVVLQAAVQLAGETDLTSHFQREEMQFYPGEEAHQAFRRQFFNGICGGCHGSLSGLELDVAVNPDILTQASSVEAVQDGPRDLSVPISDPAGPFEP